MANTPDGKPATQTPSLPTAAIFPASGSTNEPVLTPNESAGTYLLSDPQPNAPSELNWKGNDSSASLTVASKALSNGVRPSDDRNRAFIVADTATNKNAAITTAAYKTLFMRGSRPLIRSRL